MGADRPRTDQNSEPAERLRLAIDEHKNLVVDNFLFGVDEEIEFAEKRIKRVGERITSGAARVRPHEHGVRLRDSAP
jgi:hypothetical protein